MSDFALIKYRPRVLAAHWVRHFSLFRGIPIKVICPDSGAPDGAVAGGGSVSVPTPAFMMHIRRSVAKW